MNAKVNNMEEAIHLFKQCWSCTHHSLKDEFRPNCDLNKQEVFLKGPHNCTKWSKQGGLVLSVNLHDECECCGRSVDNGSSYIKHKLVIDGVTIQPVCDTCIEGVFGVLGK
jgi:hypothetical protein